MYTNNLKFYSSKKSLTILIEGLTFIVLLFLSQVVFSQISDGEADLLSLQANGPEVLFNDTSYRLIPKGRVYASGDKNLNDQNILWSNQIGGYDVLIEAITTRGMLQQNSALNINAYQLAYNEATRKLAVITGNIIVTTKSEVDAASIASDFNLTLVNDFPRIHRAFFKIENQAELTSKISALNQDYRIVEANLEIIENFQRAR
ncbi:MAG: hypothetical protein ACI85X_000758 [Woeseiaceae bacterium]|jgi:hypothetical protein|tara:strand:- start:540 stop:1151 length:612 start_codon:yes stop_codon:yes gene_type:complete